MSDTGHPDRRNFVKMILVSVGGFMGMLVGIPAIVYLLDPALKVKTVESWIPAGPIDNYEEGQPTLFTFTQTTQNGWERTVNSYGVYITKNSSTDATIFSNKCTHLACRVTWLPEEQKYLCPCHDGIFLANGEVFDGPPPAPLTQYESKVEEGILYFHFSEA